MKLCTKCKIFKDEKDFGQDNRYKNKIKLLACCKVCKNIHKKQYYRINHEKCLKTSKIYAQEHPEKRKEIQRRCLYHISQDQYNQLLYVQNNVCAICGQPETSKINNKLKPLFIDHDHITGEVRGLLCNSCNTLLGHAKDNIDILNNAILYLKIKRKADGISEIA